MSSVFNAQEVFNIAVEIEKNGQKFYKDAAANVDDHKNKELLTKLADMESDHEKTFSLMLDEFRNLDLEDSEEALLYLKNLADIKVFYQKEVPNKDMEEILKFAINAEKDSIVFYLGLKTIVPDSLGKDKIDFIIKEEMEHIKILSKALLSL